ncbi:MAG: pilus assembly protein PilM [Planctomycetes bacterium]|nr:pilus assembly protein PilM [Planctomycetota bacterium]
MAILTGIDPGAGSIKIVQGQMNGPLFKLLRAIEIPIDPDADAESEILTAIQSTLPTLKLKKGVTRIGVTGRDLIIRYTSVPPVPTWRLRMLMDFEVADMASSSGDPLTADYNLVHTGNESGDEMVLVGLVKSHFLEARNRALGAAGVVPQATTPNCISLFNAFINFGELHDGEYTFLLDIGDQNLEMAIQRDGELLFARNLSGGGSMFTKAIAENWKVGVEKARELKHEYGNVTPRGKASYASSQEEKVAFAIMGVAGQLSGMVQSTMNFARSQIGVRDMQIGRMYLSGGGSALKGLDAYLAQNLGIPVQRFVPENGLDLSALPPDDLDLFDAEASSFACALGLARMNEDEHAFHLDLVPTAVKKKRHFMRRTIWLAAAGVVAALFLAFTWWDLRAERDESEAVRNAARRDERRLASMRRRHEERSDEAKLIKSKIDRLAWESRGGPWYLQSQAIVQRHAPASIWVKGFRLQKKTLMPPGLEDGNKKKGGVEKMVILVEGEIQQLGEGVTTTFNKFIEDLRSESDAPLVEILRRPADSGGDFELQFDFAGWAEPVPSHEETDA